MTTEPKSYSTLLRELETVTHQRDDFKEKAKDRLEDLRIERENHNTTKNKLDHYKGLFAVLVVLVVVLSIITTATVLGPHVIGYLIGAVLAIAAFVAVSLLIYGIFSGKIR